MERYQLSLHAENLPKQPQWWWLRWVTPSSFCSVEMTKSSSSNSNNNRVVSLGKTKSVFRSSNPQWCEIFLFEFSPHEVTNITITIWDDRGSKKDPAYIGVASFEATSLYQEADHSRAVPIRIGTHHNESSSSKLHCRIEKSIQIPEAVTGRLNFHIRGLDMKNVEPGPFGLGRSDPFFEVSKKDANYKLGKTSWNVVYRSEYIQNHLNPYWESATIDLEILCYGELDRPLRITVWDHNGNGNHREIGRIETTVEKLQQQVCIKGNADRDKAIPLRNDLNTMKTYGLLCVLKADVIPTNYS